MLWNPAVENHCYSEAHRHFLDQHRGQQPLGSPSDTAAAEMMENEPEAAIKPVECLFPTYKVNHQSELPGGEHNTLCGSNE